MSWLDSEVLFLGLGTRADDCELEAEAAAALNRDHPAVEVCDVRAKKLQHKIQSLPGIHAGRLSALTVDRHNGMLAVASGHAISVFDLRMLRDPCARYTDSHSEMVSQLAFHPTLEKHLLTGADDGLVCVFNLREATEDDAIVSVLNTGSSVQRFGCFGPAAAFAYTITRTEGVSLWNIGTAERVADFSGMRMQFLEAGIDLTSLVDCMYDAASNRLQCLAGNDEGRLALLELGPATCSLSSWLPRGHSNTVRAAAAVSPECFATGGEDGIVALWKYGAAQSSAASSPSSVPVGSASAGASVMRREKQNPK